MLLGRTRSVVAGGVCMMLGISPSRCHRCCFRGWRVALGNGLFLPPLAVQVGSLYADGDPRRAHAISAYYMGINLGGLPAPLVCGSLGELLGWHWGFAAAGIGMLTGLASPTHSAGAQSRQPNEVLAKPASCTSPRNSG